MTEEQDIGKISDGARFASVLPYIKDEISKMESVLIGRVMLHIREGTLTPELAYAAWLELASYKGLAKRFEVGVRVGIAAGQRSGSALNI